MLANRRVFPLQIAIPLASFTSAGPEDLHMADTGQFLDSLKITKNGRLSSWMGLSGLVVANVNPGLINPRLMNWKEYLFGDYPLN